jgi:hypothetical protein
MCMYGYGESRSAIDEHGRLQPCEVELLNCDIAVNVIHPRCLFQIKAKWLVDRSANVVQTQENKLSTWRRSRRWRSVQRSAQVADHRYLKHNIAYNAHDLHTTVMSSLIKIKRRRSRQSL